MLGRVFRRLPAASRPRRLLAPLLVLLGCGSVALVGALVGSPMLSGGGLGVMTAALPPALLYAFASDPPDGGDDGGGGPGGGPDGPPRPDGGGGPDGVDWAAFDAERRGWERTPAGV